MKVSISALVLSSVLLASCGFESKKSTDFNGGASEKTADGSPEQPKADDVTAEETGSLAFDLSGLQMDAASDESDLSLTSVAEPGPGPVTVPFADRFELFLEGNGKNGPWKRSVVFSQGQKEVLVSDLPVGGLSATLNRYRGSELFQSAVAKAEIKKDQKTALTLELRRVPQKDDTGVLVISVKEASSDPSFCELIKLAPVAACAAPVGEAPKNQVCTLTIAGKAYTETVGWCTPRHDFLVRICAKGVKLTEADFKKAECKEVAEICTAIAGNLYSVKDASVIPFRSGCEELDLLKSGKAVPLSKIPALFAKGEICTKNVSEWAHPKSKEVVTAVDGCQAAGLKAIGFLGK